MGIIVRFFLLITLALPSLADSGIERLAPGHQLPDFTLPAVNGWGQRLAEVKGTALMLVWLDDCDRCEEMLAPYQLLAEGLQRDGLTTWFIWTPDDEQRPPAMRLPVLIADPKWRTGWRFDSRPAVMLVNADGVLEHLVLGDLDDNFAKVEALLSRWLASAERIKPQVIAAE